MKKKLIAFLLAALLFSARAEEIAFTVNGRSVSSAEARISMLIYERRYAEIAEYYDNFLGLDYWSLTYANGMTAEEVVKGDVFRELVMMNVFYGMALDLHLSLTDAESSLCDMDADAFYQSLPVSSAKEITSADVQELFKKQKLADRMYSMLLGQTEADEEAARAKVDRALYTTYDAELLLALNDTEADELISLSESDSWESAAEASENRILYAVSAFTPADSDVDDKLLDAVQALEIGQKSGVVETDYGLFIVRLIDDSDPTAYEAAVEAALYEARAEAFQAQYDDLYSSAEYEINVFFWDTLTLGHAG